MFRWMAFALAQKLMVCLVRSMSCTCCDQFENTVPIRSPAALTAAIRTAQAAIHSGHLAPEDRSFLDIEQNGPWDDVVDHLFRCTACSQSFRLSAETYHGTGGIWSKVPD